MRIRVVPIMNNTSYILCVVGLLISMAPARAQWDMGLQLGAGVGRINTDLYPATSRGEYQVVDGRYSWLFGVSAAHKLSGPVSFSTGLYWSFIAGHDEYWSQGVKIMEADRQVHYLYLPLVVRATIGRFGFGAGYQLGTPLIERGTFTRYPYANGFGEYSSQQVSDLVLERTDFGVVGELGFRISDRIGSGVRYYYGLQNIKDPSDGYRSPLMNEQLVIAVSYTILSQRKAKETPVKDEVPIE